VTLPLFFADCCIRVQQRASAALIAEPDPRRDIGIADFATDADSHYVANLT